MLLQETSVDGFGTLIIENVRLTDAGAYSCEAINNQESVFGNPDAIVRVIDGTPCKLFFISRSILSKNSVDEVIVVLLLYRCSMKIAVFSRISCNCRPQWQAVTTGRSGIFLLQVCLERYIVSQVT